MAPLIVPDTTAVNTIAGTVALDVSEDERGVIRLRFTAPAGLYQVSALWDARDYDWEEMYEDLANYGNTGQRTGPWDFKLGPSTPLVPSFWTAVDGRRVGLWFAQRVSLDDLAHRRFRGRMAFHLTTGGQHELELTPYRDMAITCRHLCLENDPEDRLSEGPSGLCRAPGNVPEAAWAKEGFWAEQRRRLDTSYRVYAEPMRRTFEWALAREQVPDGRASVLLDVPVLVAAHRLGGRPDALERALAAIDQAIELPHWGNQQEDGYSHDGDMGAALLLRASCWAYHILGDRLGATRRERLLAKLRLQGERFFDLILVNRDYWGGSVLQDHGWRSLWAFGTATLNLLGVLPEADAWWSYVLPRVRRGLAAMPPDGVLPPSSYCSPWLYLSDFIQFRDTLMALGGPDLLDEGPFQAVVETLATTLRADGATFITPQRVVPFTGSLAFLARMAAKHGDARTAWLHDRMLAAAEQRDDDFRTNFQTRHDVIQGFFAMPPDMPAPAPTPPPPRRALTYFDDAAQVHYHDADSDMTLVLRCGPADGYHAHHSARGPCDRLGWAPRDGHFCLYLGTTPMLANPDAGYRLHTFTGSCLLVDGQGQNGDVGYPMSIPSWQDGGAGIEEVRWDDASGTGLVRLNLQPSYPALLGMSLYVRELVLGADGRVLCRDHVAFDTPHTLSWLFQADKALGITLESPGRCRIGDAPCLWIEPEMTSTPLTASVHDTDVVYSYSSKRHKFMHARYDTIKPVASACASFELRWARGD